MRIDAQCFSGRGGQIGVVAKVSECVRKSLVLKVISVSTSVCCQSSRQSRPPVVAVKRQQSTVSVLSVS